ncbi:hypothetical protein SISNIDRAFT_452914 [Sistotremastrum niveocremeum HHB9708]|uniref:Dipeptidyl aminopeptidase n=1 Tax=Sistotremastrum niveocremeum HHB9708 TaxID=1314777 RepID=A0A164W6S2_9AGAM|nr:hypothetical protein SISNIDRAFT_452914 [Sistotremastrum niveocremeum HHB9708]
MDHIFNGTFSVERKSLRWIPEAGDGVFSIEEEGEIRLVDLAKNETRTLVRVSDIKDERGDQLYFNTWKPSPDMRYLLLKSDHLKQWRHSSFGNYHLHDLHTSSTTPLLPPSYPPTIAYATFSPSSPPSILFVSSNDIYIVPSTSLPPPPLSSSGSSGSSSTRKSLEAIKVTTDGSKTTFNGVPDWVYEEEVFSSDYTSWFSPDSKLVAYLRFDERDVREFEFPVYNPSWDNNKIYPYPEKVVMRYPKPGYSNPTVSIHILNLTSTSTSTHEITSTELNWSPRRPILNSIITEVVWLDSTHLMLRETDRGSTSGSVVLFDLSEGGGLDGGKTKVKEGVVVRTLGRDGEEGDSGWIDARQSIHPLPNGRYLDIVPKPEGYDHIALFDAYNASTARWLTFGTWEVASSGISSVYLSKSSQRSSGSLVDDLASIASALTSASASEDEEDKVYFVAGNPSSIERHLYSVPIPHSFATDEVQPPTRLTPLTTPSQPDSNTGTGMGIGGEGRGGGEGPSVYSARFSPGGGYYVLGYEGPGVPWSRVVSVKDETFNYVLTDNAALVNTTAQFQQPTYVRSTIMNEGYELNTVEIRPPGMDDSGRTKYPVLFHVYGGPNSQLTTTTFQRDWHHYLSCTLKYIIVTVDGRGTGMKGRGFRNVVRGDLGRREVEDQVAGAREWSGRKYVDRERVGIWGWSYGGYMTLKVAEANAGLHSLFMSVAPVTSWRLYDSIYTERYMDLPGPNFAGYDSSAVTNVSSFDSVNLAIAHGSGDDNVHFANTAHLIDLFTKAHIRKYRFRMFTDSDHSISTRGAYRELHEWLTAFIVEKWGKGGSKRQW